MKHLKILAAVIVAFMMVALIPVPTSEAAAKIIKVNWDGGTLITGQVGKITVLKKINLWKRDSSKGLVFERVLKPGESYRVYKYDSKYGGQYGVGGNYYISNMAGYISYKTPSRSKLLQVNPQAVRKLSIGTVTKEKATVLKSGLTKTEMTVSSSRGPQQVFVMDVDQKSSNLSVEVTLGNDKIIGKETVLSQAKGESYDGHYVLAGVNGDYYNTANGAPTDLTVHDGNVLTTNLTAAVDRTIFGVLPNGTALIGNPELNIKLRTDALGSIEVHEINKRRNANQLILYTPAFNKTTDTNDLGTEVIVNNIQGNINGNGTVEATVKEVIVGKGGTTLQVGEMVLSGIGLGANYLKQLTSGQQVNLDLNYDQPAWSGVKEAVGGRYRLVKNGVAQASSITGVNPRTAIGIKKDGKVFTVVVDGRISNYSVGLTLTELGKLMKDLGAQDAITFDGGGSTTLVTAEGGGVPNLSVVNKPSDGSQRAVANSLLFVWNYFAGPVAKIEIVAPSNNLFFVGAKYIKLTLDLKGYDKEGFPLMLESGATFSSDKGTFSGGDVFTAAKTAGKGKITATLLSNGLTGSTPIIVTDKLDQVKTKDAFLFIDQKSGSVLVNAIGYVGGKEIVNDSDSFTYTVSGDIGHVSRGSFFATKEGSGTVTVTAGGASTTIPVLVGKGQSAVIESFESGKWEASGANYHSVSVAMEKAYVKEGKQSLKVAYDFTGKSGTSGVYATPSTAISIPGKPTKIGMWVYGDAKGHWLRSELTDHKGKAFQVDYAKTVDWKGWKYVEADIPSGFTAPYKITVPVRYMETDNALKNNGQIFIDQLQAIY